MQVEEYMAEVRGIHLELARLSEHLAQAVGDSPPEGSADARRSAALAQRQHHLHLRLTQLDALVRHAR